MNTMQSPAPRVNPAPFRPLLAPPSAVTYWRDDCQQLHVLLASKRVSKSYELIPLSTDIGGCAFRWHQKDGESYDVLLNGSDSSCSCAGWAYTGGCKHIQTTFELLELGVLSVAPGSAGFEDDDAA